MKLFRVWGMDCGCDEFERLMVGVSKTDIESKMYADGESYLSLTISEFSSVDGYRIILEEEEFNNGNYK